MKRVLVISAVSMMGLMACGPGARIGGDKQGAAQALFGASKASTPAANKQAGGVDITGSLSFSCPEGGSANLSGFGAAVDLSGGSTAVKQQFTMQFNDCGAAKSDQGVAKYNGSWTATQGVNVNASEVDVNQNFKGKLLVQGAFDDFIDADVTQQVKVSDLATTGANVSMYLKGTITDKSGTYTFDENVTVTSDTLIADVSKK